MADKDMVPKAPFREGLTAQLQGLGLAEGLPQLPRAASPDVMPSQAAHSRGLREADILDHLGHSEGCYLLLSSLWVCRC